MKQEYILLIILVIYFVVLSCGVVYVMLHKGYLPVIISSSDTLGIEDTIQKDYSENEYNALVHLYKNIYNAVINMEISWMFNLLMLDPNILISNKIQNLVRSRYFSNIFSSIVLPNNSISSIVCYIVTPTTFGVIILYNILSDIKTMNYHNPHHHIKPMVNVGDKIDSLLVNFKPRDKTGTYTFHYANLVTNNYTSSSVEEVQNAYVDPGTIDDVSIYSLSYDVRYLKWKRKKHFFLIDESVSYLPVFNMLDFIGIKTVINHKINPVGEYYGNTVSRFSLNKSLNNFYIVNNKYLYPIVDEVTKTAHHYINGPINIVEVSIYGQTIYVPFGVRDTEHGYINVVKATLPGFSTITYIPEHVGYKNIIHFSYVPELIDCDNIIHRTSEQYPIENKGYEWVVML